MAADIKAKNWQAVQSRIAEGFQSVHPDGVRDRAAEIALLKKMNFGDFTLSDFKSTTIGDNIVVTFTMSVAETIDGKRLPAKPAYRLSVWKKERTGGSGFATPTSIRFVRNCCAESSTPSRLHGDEINF
jgi:hypothetical protein